MSQISDLHCFGVHQVSDFNMYLSHFQMFPRLFTVYLQCVYLEDNGDNAWEDLHLPVQMCVTPWPYELEACAPADNQHVYWCDRGDIRVGRFTLPCSNVRNAVTVQITSMCNRKEQEALLHRLHMFIESPRAAAFHCIFSKMTRVGIKLQCRNW